jgi:hypothetical protein
LLCQIIDNILLVTLQKYDKNLIMQEKETGWVSALIKCDLCGHESLSVHKYSCNKLECTNCGHMSHFEILENYTDESNTK